MTQTPNSLDSIVAQANGLYSLPAVAMEVLELTSSEPVDVVAIKKCIEVDPALTAKLLKVVNSSLYGLGGRVADLNQAITMLGTKPLKLLVLGFSLPTELFDGVQHSVLMRFWQQTLAKAVASRAFAQAGWQELQDEAFLAGLLQDIGILVLVQQLGEPYVQVLDRAYQEDVDLTTLENAAFGFDHTVLGSRLFQYWGLPNLLVDAVASRSISKTVDASLPATEPLPQILHLADLLVRFLAHGNGEIFNEMISWAKHYRSIPRSTFEPLIKSLEESIVQLAETLSVELEGGVDYRDLLLRAQQQLANVTEDAAADLARLQSDEESRQPSDDFTQLFPDEFWDQASGDKEPTKNEPAKSRSEEKTKTAGPTLPEPATAAAAEEPWRKGLLETLTGSVGVCRQARCPVSLMLVQWEQADVLVKMLGADGFPRLHQLLALVCRGLQHEGMLDLDYGPAGRGLILPDCDRHPAVELGRELLSRMNELASRQSSVDPSKIQVGIGTATVTLPPKNFPPASLVTAAEGCLFGSIASGGGVVKSIEIY